jgi:xanthine dehydrogenase accessory factor
MQQVLKAIAAELELGQPLAVATVLDSSGSAPRTAGAKMLVRQDGSTAGTVGGGQVEAVVMEAAGSAIAGGQSVLLRYTLRGGGGEREPEMLDMVCGGKMELLVHVLAPPDLAASELYGRLLQERRGVLLTLWQAGEGDAGQPLSASHVAQCLVTRRGQLLAGRPGPPHDRLDLAAAVRDLRAARRQRQGQSWVLAEPLFCGGRVYLCGGGHVSLQLADLCQRVGFAVEVMDDREAFASPERFPRVDRVRQVQPGFYGCLDPEELDGDSYVVSVTRGHAHDLEVLVQALSTRAGYVGMIGSKRKRATTFKSLLERGFQQQQIDRVHCPIGLSIGAETPEEIAVSIVAELIQVRAARAATA